MPRVRFGPLIQGATVFTLGVPFDAAQTLEILRDYPIEGFCGAPTVYRMLVQQDLAHASAPTLKRCCSAGCVSGSRRTTVSKLIGSWGATQEAVAF